MIWTILLVALLGFGMLPGALALTLFCIGFAGKLFSEAVEAIDMGQVEAIRSAGGNPLQVFVFAVLPQVRVAWTGITIYTWDVVFRAATVVGFFGAGGMGWYLRESVQRVASQGRRRDPAFDHHRRRHLRTLLRLAAQPHRQGHRLEPDFHSIKGPSHERQPAGQPRPLDRRQRPPLPLDGPPAGRRLRRRLRARLHHPGGAGRRRAVPARRCASRAPRCSPTASSRASPTRTTCRSSPACRPRCTASAATTSTTARPTRK